MTWNDFKDLVRTHLGEYATTQGAQTLIGLLIRGGVEDLQSAVPSLRRRTIQTPAVAAESIGETQRFNLGRGAFLVDLFARSTTDRTVVRRYIPYTQARLNDLQQGNLPANTRAYIYDPRSGDIFVSPTTVAEGSELCITFDLMSSDFGDSDEVLLSYNEAEAVSEYVLRKLCLNIDHDPQMSAVHDNLYRGLKRQIMSDFNEARLTSINS